MRKITLPLVCFAILLACNKPQKADTETEEPFVLIANSFSAVPMPTKLITGDPYPTDSVVVNTWVKNSSQANNLETNPNIINHGWALWQALTEYTQEESKGQTLRRFETWYTPSDIISAYGIQQKNANAKLMHVPRNTGKLTKPNQFHAADIPGNPSDAGVVGFVKYDPSAAEHAYNNKLFYASILEQFLKEGEIGNVPDFPSSSVTLKPVFSPLTNPNSEGLYTIPAWPGEPDPVTQPYGSSKWNNNVFVTIDGESDPENNIYSVREFIFFRLDSAQAKFEGAKVGDYAVLQGMHVTSRENKRWTWQTFWWSKNPDQPFAPSSPAIASLRPTNYLDQGANHYAMAIGYNMVIPSQPYNGGSAEDATSLYAYNPYLEASFNEATFSQGNDSVRLFYTPQSQMVGGYMNIVGMQTNCMSCHSQARFTKGSTSALQLYLTDQYVPMNAEYFKSTVKLDFAWSIQGNLIDDEGNLIK